MPNTKIRYVDFSADEWLAGTAMLSDQERGIYWQACALIYSRGGPIETDLLRAFCSSRLDRFNRCLDRLVALDKLQRSGSKLGQRRAETELVKSHNRAITASKNGRNGGRPSNKNNGIAKPGGLYTPANHQPSPTKTYSSPQEAADGFRWATGDAGARDPLTGDAPALPVEAVPNGSDPKPEPLTPEQQKMYDQMIAKREYLA